MSLGQIQGSSVKNASEVVNLADLLNDTKIYVPTLGKRLSQGIVDGNLGGSAALSQQENTEVYLDLSTVSSGSTVIHKADSYAVYDLPTPSVGAFYEFTNEQALPSNSTNIIIDSSNQVIYWTSGATPYSANISTSTYTFSGLATAIQTAMNGAADPNTYTVAFSDVTKKYTVTRSSGSNNFGFTFGTNSTNSAMKAMGMLPIDDSLATVQESQSIRLEARIRATDGAKIWFRNNLVEDPGFLAISRRGVTLSLMGISADTWICFNSVEDQFRKNFSQGDGYSDVSLVGKDAWVTKTAAPAAKARAAGFSLNNYGYSCNGRNPSNVNSVYQYNQSSDTWATKATAGTARNALAGFNLDGFGHVVGGFTSSSVNNHDRYNDSTNVWNSAGTSGFSARYLHKSEALNGYAYALTGIVGVANSTSVQRYNNNLDTWATVTSAIVDRQGHTAFTLNGYIYSTHGTDSVGLANSNEQYNDSANTWITKASGATARQLTGWGNTSLNSYGYITGGQASGGTITAEVSEYNDALNSFLTKTSMPTAKEATSNFVISGKLYAALGESSGSTHLTETVEYN